MPRTIRKKPKKVQKKFKKVQRKKKPRKKSLTKGQKIGIALGSIGGAALLGTGGYLALENLKYKKEQDEEFSDLVTEIENYMEKKKKYRRFPVFNKINLKPTDYEKLLKIPQFVNAYEEYKNLISNNTTKTAKKRIKKKLFPKEHEQTIVDELEEREEKKRKNDVPLDQFGKKNKKRLKRMVKSPAFIAGVTGTAAALGGLFALNEKWYSDYVKKRKKRGFFQKAWTKMSGEKPPITPYEKFMGYEKRYKKSKKKFGKKVSKKPSTSLRKLCKKYKVRLTVKRKGKRVYKSEKVLKKQCKNAMKRKK